MSAHKEYTESDHAAAVRLYKKGWGCLKISQVIGCYPSTIKRWIEDAIAAGADIKKNPAPDYPESFKGEVIAAYLEREDLSLLKVAKLFSIGSHTLRRWLDDSGTLTRVTKPPTYDRAAIIVDIASGMKKKDIATKHGCSESWVYRVQSGG